MSGRQTVNEAQCPHCHQTIALTLDLKLYVHGPWHQRCPGSDLRLTLAPQWTSVKKD